MVIQLQNKKTVCAEVNFRILASRSNAFQAVWCQSHFAPGKTLSCLFTFFFMFDLIVTVPRWKIIYDQVWGNYAMWRRELLFPVIQNVFSKN